MSLLALWTLTGIMTVALLGWLLQREFLKDRFAAIFARGRDARVASRAALVDGGQKIDVALMLQPSEIVFFTASSELEAHIDIDRIDEVEYDNELATGGQIDKGQVLRLRSHGQAYEFLLDDRAAASWASHLPPHRMDEPGRVRSI